MVGFLIATHGGFAKGILDSIELIAGKQQCIDTIAIMRETSIDAFGQDLIRKIIDLDEGDGVVVFCDLLLASPYNQATMSYRTLQGKHEYRILSGANLPMILEALSGRMQNMGIDDISHMAQNAGREGIQEFFEEFAKLQENGMIQ